MTDHLSLQCCFVQAARKRSVGMLKVLSMRVHVVGDIMLDAINFSVVIAEKKTRPSHPYMVIFAFKTLPRPVNRMQKSCKYSQRDWEIKYYHSLACSPRNKEAPTKA